MLVKYEFSVTITLSCRLDNVSAGGTTQLHQTGLLRMYIRMYVPRMRQSSWCDLVGPSWLRAGVGGGEIVNGGM